MAIADLITARENLEAQLAAETAARLDGSANCKPSYSIEGRSVDWVTWRRHVIESIAELTKAINARSPFIISTRQTL